MSKPKSLLKQGKLKKKKEQLFETPDDFQAAGVDFEEAAGKWRAGDAVKSMRFFLRAIEVYDQGLTKFPTSFDLAYNKARVQLEIATHPILVQQLQAPVLAVLEEALTSHRYALRLDQNNADALFNTSQVLTSIAEEVAKDNQRPDQDALQLLEEALQLQNRCLEIQERMFEETQKEQSIVAQQAADDSPSAAETVSIDDNPTGRQLSGSAEDHWFAIVEPVTQDTLIDTALAQLGTLTTLTSILGPAAGIIPTSSLEWVEEYSSEMLGVKLPRFAIGATNVRLQEIALARANFVSILLEACFRWSKIEASTYQHERDAVFKIPELSLETSFEGLLANAKSLVAFNAALAEALDTASYRTGVRWSAISTAISSLTAASKLPAIASEEVSKTHLLRGDCSLLQWRLGQPPHSYEPALKNSQQLLKNAEVFYRNAGRLNQAGEQQDIANLKSAISHHLQNNNDLAAIDLASRGSSDRQDWVGMQIAEMVDDGLLPPLPLDNA